MRLGGLPPCTRSSVAPGRSGSWSLSPILGGKPTLTGPLAVFPDKWIHSILFLSPKANSRALLLSLSTGQDLRQACVVHALLGCCGGAGGGGRLGVFISVLGRWPGEARCCTVSCPAGLLPAVWAPERGWGGLLLCLRQVPCSAAQHPSQASFPAGRGPVGQGHRTSARRASELLLGWGSGHTLRTDRKIPVLRFGKFAQGQPYRENHVPRQAWGRGRKHPRVPRDAHPCSCP